MYLLLPGKKDKGLSDAYGRTGTFCSRPDVLRHWSRIYPVVGTVATLRTEALKAWVLSMADSIVEI